MNKQQAKEGPKEECPSSKDGIRCPECGVWLKGGHGFTDGYGFGGYSYCKEHGVFDFAEDLEDRDKP